jgi:DNA-binding response OmpR family regulator
LTHDPLSHGSVHRQRSVKLAEVFGPRWGVNEDPLTNVVDVYIGRLRSKIDEGHVQPLIHTVRGLGYRLEALPE